VSVIWALETSVLRDIAIILVVYGALVLLTTALAGPNRPAVAFRRSLARLPSDNHPIVVWAAALFLFLIVLAWGPTAGNRQLLGVVILAATTAFAIEALRRQTLREFPRIHTQQSARPRLLRLSGAHPDRMMVGALASARMAPGRVRR
jgi:hypothetical protein